VIGEGGPVDVKSSKQKFVTKSSTEAELVAASNYASQALWIRNFLQAQGYDTGPAVLHQDNMSAMALMKRGGPASEKSRHIAIRHFWVKERADAGEMVVRHLPTAMMLANIEGLGIDLEMHPGCHAPRVERKIRELKEYVRGQINAGVDYRLCNALIKLTLPQQSTSCSIRVMHPK